MIDLHRRPRQLAPIGANVSDERREHRRKIKTMLRSAGVTIAIVNDDERRHAPFSADTKRAAAMSVALGFSCCEPLLPPLRYGAHWVATFDLLLRYYRRYAAELAASARADLDTLTREEVPS